MQETLDRAAVQQMEVSSKRKLNSKRNDKNEEGTLKTLQSDTWKQKNSCNEINIHNGKILENKKKIKKKNLKGNLKSKIKHTSEIPVSTHDKFQDKGRKRKLPFPENSGANDFNELCSGPFVENDCFQLDYGSSEKKKFKKNCENSFDGIMQHASNAKTQSLSLQTAPCALDKKVFLKSKSPTNVRSDFVKHFQKKLHRFEGREDTPERLNRTVFVGNLPISFNRKLLHVLFQSFGEIDSVRIRSAVPARSTLPKKVAVIRKQFHCKSDSFNGYVVFKNVEDVEKALTLNKTVVQGHHIRVDRFKVTTDYDGKRSVFVGNLPYDVTTESLWPVFGECGSIEAIRIIRDPETGLGKGFGFVLFEECDSVERALLLGETQVDGRSIRIKPVEKGNRLEQKTSVKNHRTNLKMEKKRKKNLPRSQESTGQKRKTNKKLKKKKIVIQKKKHIMSILTK